jgi:hypothetical protein
MAPVVGIVAGLLMYYFPPRVQVFTEKGEAYITWIGNPIKEQARLGRRQRWLSNAGPGLLVIAFLLQLASALLSFFD